MLRAVLFGITTTSTTLTWPGPHPVIIPNVLQSTGAVRTETVEIANGGELAIFLEKLRGGGQTERYSEMPLLAALRDTQVTPILQTIVCGRLGCSPMRRRRRNESLEAGRSFLIDRGLIAGRQQTGLSRCVMRSQPAIRSKLDLDSVEKIFGRRRFAQPGVSATRS